MKSREKKIALTVASAVILGAAVLAIAQRDGNVSHQAPQSAVVHHNVITTYFWVGETSDADNGGISNVPSAWDDMWQAHYGGVDNPDNRKGYKPAGFTPKENPFYIALPYNDINADGNRKASADSCKKYQPNYDAHYSACKNIWVAIKHAGTTVYAQWEDAGPFGEDDTPYVFGTAQPQNTQGMHAGLDVSPAVRDYLSLNDVDRTDWHFVSPSNVPDGPWKDIVTTSRGESL
jgi:hypothetical protein